jgi:hypothetical protein
VTKLGNGWIELAVRHIIEKSSNFSWDRYKTPVERASVVTLRKAWTRGWVANLLSLKIQRMLAQYVDRGEVTLQFIAFEQPPDDVEAHAA